jgi:hypothetical protein
MLEAATIVFIFKGFLKNVVLKLEHSVKGFLILYISRGFFPHKLQCLRFKYFIKGFATFCTFIKLVLNIQILMDNRLNIYEKCFYIFCLCKGSLENDYADVNQDLNQC